MAPISVLANNDALPTQKEQQKQNHSQPQIQAQNQQQHPFLFQPHHHQYSSGDDGDSPPSLTNSSESPRSVSEEGETSSSRFDIFHGVPQKGMVESSSQGRPDDDSKDGRIEGEGEDSIMSPVQAAGSPNWESVFASSIGTDDVDMSASMAASTMADSKQWNSATPQERENPTQLTSAGTDSSKEGIGERQGDAWPSNNPFSNIQQWMPESSNKANDEAMFDSLIQEDSFDASEATEADANQSVSDRSINASVIGARSAAATTTHEGIPAAASQQALQSSNAALPTMQMSSTRASTSALSSRRNSVEAEPKQRIAKVPHCGSHYSHTSDADLPTSSQVVVRPSRAELSGLQVHVHGIAFTGAKSRVETQIRTRIELVRPVSSDGSKQGASAFERIGTFNHVKLPPLTGTKRKSKKHKPSEISAETTLFMDATVVRATPPHDRVLVCASCQQRERKRAQRKRTNSTKKGAEQDRAADEDVYTNEELQEYGIDPAAVDAQEQARQRASLEDEKRVVVFNCGDFINFEEGACVLPTRITCYCRHHKEKTGFCLIFTMRDYKGNLIATGSTPPIMITDDHKSVAAAQAAAASQPLSLSRRGGNTRSRGTSTEALDELPNMRSIGRDSLKKKRNSRARPYGDADDRASRRNTLQNSNMTPPYASTGQNTPALGTSPPSHADMNQTDFWNAFAAMSTLTGSPQGESSQASNGAPTPHESALSPLAQPSPGHQPVHRGSASQQAAGVGSQDWLAHVHSQGSLSSQTLNLCPQSLPGFDLDAFSRSLQQSSQSSSDDAAMQQLFMLARSLPGMESTGTQGGDRLQQIDSASGASLSIPLISKLIPGEGPTSGGIEVTVLGENFTDNLTCVFGDVPATSTKVWGSNTLLCILPPSVSPGPVAVSIKRPGDHSQNLPGQDHYGRSLQLFTYVDTTDRALMELALQVVGLQMTGQMQTARDVAMRVVGSGGGNAGLSRSQSGTEQQQGGSGGQRSQMRSAVPGIFAGAQGKQSFQDGVMQFLTTLDEPIGAQRREAIRLANKQGHTLLHLTTILGFHRLALSLVQRGCPINARDHNGYTALHFAALHGRMTIARMLLSKGARWNVECEAGKYPLDVARERDQIDVELLLEERMGEGAWSEDDETDDDLYEEEEEDDLSDWMTDESEEVDADNVSTLADDSIGPADSTEEVCAGEEAAKSSVREKTASPVTTGQSTPKADEKKADYSHGALLPVQDGQQQDMGRKAMETKTGLKGLVSGGIDFAQKWPLGMPTMLHDRFPLMQMPTVSVFQMVLPPTLMNWAHQQEGDASSSASVAKDKGRSGEEERQQAPDDASTGLAMWRNIIEESAMWINPLYSPPPTYETALHHARKGVRGDERQSQGGREAVEPQDQPVAAAAAARARAPSRFPAIAEASPDSPHKDRRAKQQQQRSETSRSSSSRHTIQSSASTSATPSSSSSSTSRLGVSPSPSSSSLHSARSTTATTQRNLNEDRMLVYFWLPTLVFVMLLLCFAKPSSVLSYKDLVSFMPI